MHADYRNVSFINKSRVVVICCKNTVLFSFMDGAQKLLLPYEERNTVIFFYFLFRKSSQRT